MTSYTSLRPQHATIGTTFHRTTWTTCRHLTVWTEPELLLSSPFRRTEYEPSRPVCVALLPQQSTMCCPYNGRRFTYPKTFGRYVCIGKVSNSLRFHQNIGTFEKFVTLSESSASRPKVVQRDSEHPSHFRNAFGKPAANIRKICERSASSASSSNIFCMSLEDSDILWNIRISFECCPHID
jgi:hypothetical protein